MDEYCTVIEMTEFGICKQQVYLLYKKPVSFRIFIFKTKRYLLQNFYLFQLYEIAIVNTNAVYKIGENELIPSDEFCGTVPKIEMLKPDVVIFF